MGKKADVPAAAKAALASRTRALECTLTQMANASGVSMLEREDVVKFFRDYMDGQWDAYEEATAHHTEEARQLDASIADLQEQVQHLLGEANAPAFFGFTELINRRMTSELEHAYLVGYQAAMRFLLLGVLPLKAILCDDSAGQTANDGFEAGKEN